ncbi:hypothetical protein BV898_17524 [Hypsibius exemplaris]|uniref:Uncharacterized protein n=1 Tax=Hypsibius exemplaris TaxID=2072580 RepID=A0A9X6RMJ3_HYPEX|nr:hypothetical protein BV898_17524 [Hypsibius exemplaris]
MTPKISIQKWLQIIVYSLVLLFFFTFLSTERAIILHQSIPKDSSGIDSLQMSNSNLKASFFDPAQLDVHYVKIYRNFPPIQDDQFCFLECVALLSVLKNLQSRRVYFHSNAPKFWPFSSCASLISHGNLTSIKMMQLHPTTLIGGRSVTILHHQADIAKLQILRDFGGVVMDMDVFIVNGQVIGRKLKQFSCVLSQEGSRMLNAGFAACRRGARWPDVMLEEYRKDYRSDWYYNSAILPFKKLRDDRRLRREVYVDNTISNNPDGKKGFKMLDMKDAVDWRGKVGFQSFYHDCNLGVAYVNHTQTGFGELLRWILYSPL